MIFTTSFVFSAVVLCREWFEWEGVTLTHTTKYFGQQFSSGFHMFHIFLYCSFKSSINPGQIRLGWLIVRFGAIFEKNRDFSLGSYLIGDTNNWDDIDTASKGLLAPPPGETRPRTSTDKKEDFPKESSDNFPLIFLHESTLLALIPHFTFWNTIWPLSLSSNSGLILWH